MEEKWNLSPEDINKAIQNADNKIRINTLIKVLIGIVVIILVGYFILGNQNNNKQTRQLNENSYAENQSNTTANYRNKNLTTGSENVEKQKQFRSTENFSSYINSSIINSSSNTEISVTIVDENGNISTSASSEIANIYNQSGLKGNTGLLRSSFIQKSGFQELFEGNNEIIEKLKLSDHTDYLAIGKIKYKMRIGELVEGTTICSATISMSIISANSKTIVKTFTFSANGNGVTETQAQEEALQKLITIYYNEHSSI